MRRVLAGAGRARILRGEWPDDAQTVADAPDPGRRDDVGDRDLRAVLAADDPDALTPLVALLVAIPVTVVVGNIMAAIPAWTAGQIQPSRVLRQE